MNLINLINLYDYDIFDNIQIPTGIDKEVLVNTILDYCGIYEPLYTDENFLKAKIQNFFLKNKLTYEKLYEAYTVEYNLIENLKRNETTTVTNTRTGTVEDTRTDTSKVSAYDSATFEDDTLNTGNNLNEIDISESQTTTYSGTGSIGVITSQDMLEKELSIRSKLNLYEIIARDFYKDFMIFTV